MDGWEMLTSEVLLQRMFVEERLGHFEGQYVNERLSTLGMISCKSLDGVITVVFVRLAERSAPE